MKHRKAIVLSFVILAIAGMVVGIYWSRWTEPWYEGRSLRSWLEHLPSPEERFSETSPEEAVQHMGTNAIPALLRMFRAKDSPLMQKLDALNNKFEFLPYLNTAEHQHGLASLGFIFLGSDASNAIPELMGIYHENIPKSELAFKSLLRIVPPSERFALAYDGLTNRNEGVRKMVVWELTPTSVPEESVPLLIRALADKSPRIQSSAALRLGQFGTNALPAVSALVPLAAMGCTNDSYYSANQTLIELDPSTAAKVLTNGYRTYERYTNYQAQSLSMYRLEAMENAKRGKVYRTGQVHTNK